MPAGILGSALPVLAAEAAALAASKVNTPTAFGIAAYETVVETPEGSVPVTGM